MAHTSIPKSPQGDAENPVPVHETAHDPNNEPSSGGGAGVRLPNTHEENRRAAQTTEQRQQRWKTVREWAAIVISIAAAAFSFGSCYGSNRSARVAERALKTTVENFRLDQRAWVSLTKMVTPSEIKAGVSQIRTIGVEFTNSGKTQALDANVIVAGRLLLKDVPFSPVYKGEAQESRMTLRPGARYKITIPSMTLRQEQIDAIRNGTLMFYVYGEISYEDIFAAPHCTRFCMFLSPDLKEGGYCGIYNEMTNTECEHTQ